MYYPFHIILSYPAIRIFLALASGILIARIIDWPLSALFPVAIIAVLSSLIFLFLAVHYRWSTLYRDLFILLLLTLAGMLLMANAMARLPRSMLAVSDTLDKITISGKILSSPRNTNSGCSFTLQCDSIETESGRFSVNETIIVFYSVSAFDRDDTLVSLSPGDIIKAKGKLRCPRPARNPWSYDAREHLLQAGITVTMSIAKGNDLSVITTTTPPLHIAVLSILREKAESRLAQLFHKQHLPFMRGLLLGDRGGIDRDVLDDFRISGIMHILAVSGLHAGIIVSMVLIPLERLRFSLRGSLAIAGVWLFAGITGFAPPVQRAAIMSSLYIISRLVQRPNTTINALSLAAVVVLILDPFSLYSLSFQLSFGAVLGILLFQKRIHRTLLLLVPKRLRRGIFSTTLSLLALTASAQLCTIPLTLSLFGEFSLAGFLVNLFAVPLVFVVVSCALLSVLLYPFSLWCSSVFASTAESALDVILFISHWSAAQPWAVVRPPQLPWWFFPSYGMVILWLARRQGRLRQKTVLLGLTLTAIIVINFAFDTPSREQLQVSYLDVGQGDASLIRLPGNKTVLIDTGPAFATSNSGTTVIVPYLHRLGIDTLDYLILTHSDNDHIGGTASVLDAVAVRNVLLACSWPRQPAIQQLLSRMQSKGSIVEDIREGEVITIHDQARLYFLSPETDVTCESSNHNSLVTLLRYGNTAWLFTGDADQLAEQRMQERYDTLLRADVLKVGHHGSGSSTSENFLAAVQPHHAVISAGRLNQFRHPKTDVLQRLIAAGSVIHRTDIEGAVILESDGLRIWKKRW